MSKNSDGENTENTQPSTLNSPVNVFSQKYPMYSEYSNIMEFHFLMADFGDRELFWPLLHMNSDVCLSEGVGHKRDVDLLMFYNVCYFVELLMYGF